MASITVDPPPQPPERLSLESIPTVDLRLLSQSELTALSLCSAHAFDLRRCDDVVIPKIDRSVFNESAGSRKQTYSRLRLAPRKPDLTSSGPGPKARTTTTLEPLDSERAENSRIIALFKHLFNSPASDALVPVNVEYSDALPINSSDVVVPVPVLGDGGGGERKRKRGRKPKSETTPTPATPMPLTLALVEESEKGDFGEGGEDGVTLEEREKELVNKNGVVVDLVEMAKLEDPYGEELKRRTEGREQPEELLGFMTDLEGQWGSRRKKRKIVDANEFGDLLPNGWKVLIGMKKKQGQAWLFCRRYISPAGRYFVSFKEVSSYLLSLTSPQDLERQNFVEVIEDSMVDNKLATENVADVVAKSNDPPSCVVSPSIDCSNQQKQLCTSQTFDHEKQVILSKNVLPGELHVGSALKCHKCSTPFNEKDELLNHLLSCHKRKRRKAGAPIEDDVTMKDGKYECQFCNKLFHERNSYFGHVGIHVKNYVKNIGGSPAVTGKQKTFDPVSIGGVPLTVSETLGSVEVNADSVSGAPNILASGEPNVSPANSKLKVGSEAETHSDNYLNDQCKLSAHELNKEAAQNDKASTHESSDKQDEVVHTIDNNVRQINEPADVSAVKPDCCSDLEKMMSTNENKEICGYSAQINATECARSGISSPPSVLLGNVETCLRPESNPVDLGNDGDFGPLNDMEHDGVASESCVPADNEEKAPSNQNSEDRSLDNNTVDHSCYEGVKVGVDDDELIVGSDGGNLDLDTDVADGIQHTGSLNECSAVNHEEEQICAITANKFGFMGSTLADSKVERGSGTSPCSPSGDQHRIGSQNDMGEVFSGVINEREVDLCSLEKAEVTVDADCCIAQERHSGHAHLLSKDNDLSYMGNDSEKVPELTRLEPRGSGGFQIEETCNLEDSTADVSNRVGEKPKSDQVTNMSNLFFTKRSNATPLDAKVPALTGLEPRGSGGFQIEQTCNLEDSAAKVSNRVGEEPNSDQVTNSSNFFFTDRRSTVTSLDANVMTNNEQVKTSAAFSHIPSAIGKANSDISNVLGAYDSFVENKQEQNPKSILSGLSMNEHMHEVAINNGTAVSAATTTTQLPQLDKVNSQTDKLILDFGSMTEINARFLNTVQHETIPEGSSPFSLWGETCVEGSQTRVYGGARGLAQEERPSNNNSLTFVGLQQPCDTGYNLNKVGTNEQRYNVQRNEPDLYSRTSEAGREGISHGNTLNLAGFQQQCDARYNLNKPCQQSFGVQHNEAGAYSTSDEARRERVAYGDSLSLASIQQTCDASYSLNKGCVQQTCDTGYGLNKGYIGPIQGLSKLDRVEHSRDRDLMLGFGTSSSRSNQGVATEFLWRPTEGNILPGGLVNSSSSQGQPSGSFQAFDFLSDKGGNGLYTGSEKFDNMSSFDGLRSTSVEPMEFSFLTTQNSNAQLEDPKVLSYNTEMDQGFGSSVWQQKGTSLPNMMAGHPVSTLCVWCGNEFHQDSLGCEMQAGSIGYLCPTCKARMSGQFL